MAEHRSALAHATIPLSGAAPTWRNIGAPKAIPSGSGAAPDQRSPASVLRQISCCPSDAGRAQQTEPAMHVTLIWSSPQAVGALATAKVAPPSVVANTRAGAWLSAGTTSTQCITSAQAKLPAVDVGRLRSVARTVSGPIRLRVHVRPASRVENSHVTDDAYPRDLSTITTATKHTRAEGQATPSR